MGTIAEKLQYTSDAVDDIQAAIQEKGVTVADTDALGTYGDKIRSIESGGGTDTSDATLTDGKYLASGKTAYGANGKITGSATLYEGTSGMDCTRISYTYPTNDLDAYYSGDNIAYIGFPQGIHVPNTSGQPFTGTPNANTAVKVKTNDLAKNFLLDQHPEYISYGKNLFGVDGTGHQGKINYYSKSCSFSDGTWDGWELPSGAWKFLCNADGSSWTYNHNLNLDVAKIKFIQMNMFDGKFGIRFSKGYAQSSTTQQFHYTNMVGVCTSSPLYTVTLEGEYENAYAAYYVDDYNWNSTHNGEAQYELRCEVRGNSISMRFLNNDRNMYAIYSTANIGFEFIIGYED